MTETTIVECEYTGVRVVIDLIWIERLGHGMLVSYDDDEQITREESCSLPELRRLYRSEIRAAQRSLAW